MFLQPPERTAFMSRLQPEICHIVRVLSVEIDASDAVSQAIARLSSTNSQGQTSMYELPTCPVCLERMDSAVTGLITVPCSHTFHCMCLSKWGDSRCVLILLCVSVQYKVNNLDPSAALSAATRRTCSPLGRPLPAPYLSADPASRPVLLAHQQRTYGSVLSAATSAVGGTAARTRTRTTKRRRTFTLLSSRLNGSGTTQGTGTYTG